MIGRLVRYGMATVFIAILVHTVAVLRVPAYAPRTPYDRLAADVPLPGSLTLIDVGKASVDGLDPTFANAVCRMGPDDDGLRLSGTMPDVPYWSLVVMDDGGNSLAVITRDQRDDGKIDLVLMKEDSDAAVVAAADTERIALDSSAGLVLVKAFVPFRGDRRDTEDALRALACSVDPTEQEGTTPEPR